MTTAANPILQAMQEHAPRAQPQGMVYLASPITTPDARLQELYLAAAATATQMHVRYGTPVYCPAAFFPPNSGYDDVPPPGGWYSYDLHYLAASQQLTVLLCPGWQHSIGVNMEIAAAIAKGIPIEYLLPQNAGVTEVAVQEMESLVAQTAA